MATNFNLKTVTELQSFLKERGVTYGGLWKADLKELCEQAEQVGLAVDPDFILEDRVDVLSSKLLVENGYMLQNPEELHGDTSLVHFPPFSIFVTGRLSMIFGNFGPEEI